MARKSRTFQGKPKPFGKSGHFYEPKRHSLQAKGFKTGKHTMPKSDRFIQPLTDTSEKLQRLIDDKYGTIERNALFVEWIGEGNERVAILSGLEEGKSPREWDNLGIMATAHKDYKLGEEQIDTAQFDSWDAVEKHLIKDKKAEVILPLYLYDHSGLRIKVGSFVGLLPEGHAEFDTSRVGFIYATKEGILKEYGGTKVTPEMRKKAEEVLRAEVATFDQYISGDTYCLTHYKDGEVIDSACGYYGLHHARAEAESMLKGG